MRPIERSRSRRSPRHVRCVVLLGLAACGPGQRQTSAPPQQPALGQGAPQTIVELEARATQRSDCLWWTYRFLDAVVNPEDTTHPATEDLRDRAVDAFVRLAIADPQWAMATIGDGRRPESILLAQLLSGKRLTAALSQLHLPALRTDAILRARLLSAGARWERDDKLAEELWRQAWRELSRVPEVDRNEEWNAVAVLGSAAVADYPRFRSLAISQLQSIGQDFAQLDLLLGLITSAARNRDWPTFEAWVSVWRGLPRKMQGSRSECVILNFEGVRALDDGRVADAEAILRRLLEVAPTTNFTGGRDASALPRRLRAEGRALDLCDKFDQLVKRNRLDL